MFGSSSFGNSGFGQNNTNAFGTANTGSGFGQQSTNTGSAFGGGSLFGQPSQNNAGQQASVFGQSQPAQPQGTAFGGFGSTAQPAAPSGGLFGAKPTGSTGAFGSSGFGTQTSTSPFGGATTQQSGTANQGTAVVPFQAKQETDPSRPGTTLVYESITAMPQYSNFSFEELRLQDYQQGRRMGTGGNTGITGGVQPSAAFGSSTPTNTFGQTNTAFGQSANTSSPFGNTGGSIFGQNNNTGAPAQNTGFGQSSSPFGQSNAFGQNKPAAGFGFGSTTPQNTSSGGIFGQTQNQPSVSSPFGQPQQPTQNTGFGFGLSNNNNTNTTNQSTGPFGANKFGTGSTTSSFGFGQNLNQNQNQNQNQTQGPFGQPNNQSSGFGFGNTNAQGASTGSLFGNTANKPGGLFGSTQQNTGNSGFSFGGGNTNQNANTTTGGSLFGQNNTNSTGAFGMGSNTNAATQTSTGSSLFGGNTGSSAFGQNNASKPGGLFGSTTTNNQSNSGGGLLGNNTSQPAFGSGGGSLFGNNNSNTQNTGTTGSSLFGNSTNQGTSLFGANNNNSNNASGTAGSSLFGNKPAGTSGSGGFSFGQTSAAPANSNSNTGGTGTGLFGSSNATNTTGGGLFGSNTAGSSGGNTTAFGGFGSSLAAKPAAPAGGTSLFGSSNLGNISQPSNTFGGGLGLGQQANSGGFGINNQQANRCMVANMGEHNPYGNNPLFVGIANSESKGTPFVTPLSRVPRAKKSGVLLAYTLTPRPLVSQRVSDTSKPSSEPGQDRPSTDGNKTVEAVDPLYNIQTDKIILMSEAFAPRSSIRQLIVGPEGDKTSTDEPVNSGTKIETPRKVLDAPVASSTPFAQASSTPSNGTMNSSQPIASGFEEIIIDRKADEEATDDHGYWISPSQKTLDRLPLRDLRKVKGFRIGRKDVGFIEFNAPVDLSEYSDVQRQVAGHIVKLAHRTIALYPEPTIRPPIGHGFNVPATVTLYSVWDKAGILQKGRDSAKFEQRKEKFLDHIKSIPNTKFISWDVETGTWVFSVEPEAV